LSIASTVHPKFSDVKSLKSLPRGDDEVLIKLYAASVNPLDWHFMRGKPFFAA